MSSVGLGQGVAVYSCQGESSWGRQTDPGHSRLALDRSPHAARPWSLPTWPMWAPWPRNSLAEGQGRLARCAATHAHQRSHEGQQRRARFHQPPPGRAAREHAEHPKHSIGDSCDQGRRGGAHRPATWGQTSASLWRACKQASAEGGDAIDTGSLMTRQSVAALQPKPSTAHCWTRKNQRRTRLPINATQVAHARSVRRATGRRGAGGQSTMKRSAGCSHAPLRSETQPTTGLTMQKLSRSA